MEQLKKWRKLYGYLNLLPAINNAMYVTLMTIAVSRGDDFLDVDIFAWYYVINGVMQYHAVRLAGFCLWTRLASLLPAACTLLLIIDNTIPTFDMKPTIWLAAIAAFAITTFKITKNNGNHRK